MVQDHFLQAATRITVMVRDRHSARSIPGRGFGSPSALLPGAVFGAPYRPKCRLPKSPCLAPSSYAFSSPSGGAKLAAYLCGRLQSSSREFCTGADPHR